MKRQNIGLRSSEESQQNQINEKKRLKIFHETEYFSNAELETGSGSDTTEEYINSNGQEKVLKISVTPEEISSNQHSENNTLYGSHSNGSYSNVENNSVDIISANNMNGVHTNSGGIFPQKDVSKEDCINNSEDNALETNPTSFLYSTEKKSADFQENVSSDTCESFPNETDVTDTQSPNQIQHLPSNTECSPEDSTNIQNFNVEEGSHDLDVVSTASSKKQLDVEMKNAEDISIPLNNQAGPSCSSQEENESQIDVTTLSQAKVDVENITLCELKVTQLEGHADVVFSVAADEDFILSSSGDTTVKVWNVEKRKEMSNFAGHNAAVTSVILLNAEQSEILRSKLNCFQTSRIAVSASYDCHIRLWSVLDGHEILSMYTFNSITCMGYLENQMYVVVGTEGGKLEVWDLHLAKLVHFVYAHDSSVTSLKVHDCYIYSTSKDGAVKVWLFDEGELQPLYTRRRKETSSVGSHFGPTQWQAVGVYNDMLYLGDNTCRLKALDWRLGRLRLFVNQPDDHGICEAILAKNDILLTTFFNSVSDTGGINVWRLPELSYVGTLTGDLQEICSLALIQSGERLRIVSGGHQLLVWDFDFSKPPIKTAQDPFFVCEVDKVGFQVNEESIETASKKRPQSASTENLENKKSWCNIS